jgi:hypothetical protein
MTGRPRQRVEGYRGRDLRAEGRIQSVCDEGTARGRCPVVRQLWGEEKVLAIMHVVDVALRLSGFGGHWTLDAKQADGMGGGA